MKQGEEEMQRQYDMHMQDMQILRNQGYDNHLHSFEPSNLS
jgi:hypothetical protein